MANADDTAAIHAVSAVSVAWHVNDRTIQQSSDVEGASKRMESCFMLR